MPGSFIIGFSPSVVFSSSLIAAASRIAEPAVHPPPPAPSAQTRPRESRALLRHSLVTGSDPRPEESGPFRALVASDDGSLFEAANSPLDPEPSIFPTRYEGARWAIGLTAHILLPRLTDPSVLPRYPLISAITLAELSVGPLVAGTEEERAARQAHVQQAEADFQPLPFDAQAARTFGGVAASLRRSGRKTAARAYDAMIAAVALANELPLFACNPEDFAGIDGLSVLAS